MKSRLSLRREQQDIGAGRAASMIYGLHPAEMRMQIDGHTVQRLRTTITAKGVWYAEMNPGTVRWRRGGARK